jgi:hypothetical protein
MMVPNLPVSEPKALGRCQTPECAVPVVFIKPAIAIRIAKYAP